MDDFGPLVAYEIGRHVEATISGLSEVGFAERPGVTSQFFRYWFRTMLRIQFSGKAPTPTSSPVYRQLYQRSTYLIPCRRAYTSSSSDLEPEAISSCLLSIRESPSRLLHPSLILTPCSYYRMITHGDLETALFNFALLVDPLSETGQRWAPMIKVCHSKYTRRYGTDVLISG